MGVTATEFLKLLHDAPLVASVQAPTGAPLDDSEALYRLAQSSLDMGVKALRLEGVENISYIKSRTKAPIIGLIKEDSYNHTVRITPTAVEVEKLLSTGCEVIATDATLRPRPNQVDLKSLVQQIHGAGRLALADCDSLESAIAAQEIGFDFCSTTLSGYTSGNIPTEPDIELVRQMVSALDVPVFAEGRYATREQLACALRCGARAVIAGGALNDPLKTTKSLLPPPIPNTVLAFDIGGTWLRWGVFSREWRLLEHHRIPLPKNRAEILAALTKASQEHLTEAIAISSGGCVDPKTGEVWQAKPMVPDWEGTRLFDAFEPDFQVYALNDGLATAWGHANLGEIAGNRVATLALGTGVGAGLVSGHRIFCGPRGNYPRINDLNWMDATFESKLGGASLTKEPTEDHQKEAIQVAKMSLQVIESMWAPDHVIVCGGVGLAPWLADSLRGGHVTLSPFGADAGLYGAAALALFPPTFDQPHQVS